MPVGIMYFVCLFVCLCIQVEMKSVDKDFRPARLDGTRYTNKAQTTTTRKLISWHSLRIQANADMGATTCDGTLNVAPILLITNQSSVRLTLTKRLADCVLVATKLEVHFDTFLWVLTSSQLFAAAMFARTLSLLIQRVTRQKREANTRADVTYEYEAAKPVDKDLEHGISVRKRLLFQAYLLLDVEYNDLHSICIDTCHIVFMCL